MSGSIEIIQLRIPVWVSTQTVLRFKGEPNCTRVVRFTSTRITSLPFTSCDTTVTMPCVFLWLALTRPTLINHLCPILQRTLMTGIPLRLVNNVDLELQCVALHEQ